MGRFTQPTQFKHSPTYPISQPYGQFQEPPILQGRHVYSSNGILNPDIIRCQEIDDDAPSEPSTTKKSVGSSTACLPSSSASSSSKAQDGSQEPKLKRKISTENVDTLKKAKIVQMQSMDSETKPAIPKHPGPMVDGKDSKQTVRELDQSFKDDQNPGVHKASTSQDVANAAAEPQNNTNATVEPTSSSLQNLNTPLRTPDQQDTTMSTPTTSKSRSESLISRINVPVSSNSSIEGINRQVTQVTLILCSGL